MYLILGFEPNETAYCLLAKQDVGKVLMNFAKKIDLEKFNLAEKEYNQMIKTSLQKSKEENNNE